jgi:uncharacterized protein (TIGR02099 family)
MKRILLRSVSWGWWLLSGALVLAAVGVSVLRLLAPLASEYHGILERWASQELGQGVSIGAIHTEWQGLAPRFRITDLRLYGDAQDPGEALIDSAYIVPDWIGSLLALRPRLKALSILGSEFTVVRERSGEVLLRGVSLHSGKDWRVTLRRLVESQQGITVNLLQSRVRWIDEMTGVDYRFSRVAISASSRDGVYRLSVRAALPQAAGGHLHMVVHFRGDLGEPMGWDGRVYAQVEGLQAGAFSEYRVLEGLGVQDATIGFRAWSDWRLGRPSRLVGRLRVESVTLKPARGTGPQGPDRVDRAAVDVRWLRHGPGWSLSLGDLTVEAGGRHWRVDVAGLEYRIASDGTRLYRGVSSSLPLGELLPLAARHPWWGDLPQRVQGWALEGELKDLLAVVEVGRDGIQGFGVSARFTDLGLSGGRDRLSFMGLDGQLSLDQSSGELVLEARDAAVDYSTWFPEGLYIERLDGRLHWEHTEQGQLLIRADGLSLDNEDMALQGEGELRLGQGSPYVDLGLRMDRGDGARLRRYLPKAVLPPKVYDWLIRSIRQGRITRGGLVFRGHIADFPFTEGEGLLEVDAQVEDGVLSLRPGVPELTGIHVQLGFHNASMELTGGEARLGRLALQDTRVRIDDLKKAALKVRTRVRGPLADMARAAAGLYPAGAGRVVATGLEVQGPAELSLDLDLPLSRRSPVSAGVRGRVRFQDATLALPDYALRLEALNGTLGFAPEGLSGQAIHGRWRAHPIEIDLDPRQDASTRVRLQGRLDVKTLLRGVDSPVVARITGQSEWYAQLHLPAFARQGVDRPVRVSLRSNLIGTAVDLPAPLGKPADRHRPFKLSAEIIQGGLGPITVAYGDGASAALQLVHTGQRWSVGRGELRFNRGAASLPDRGFRITGSLARLSLSEWRPWYSAFTQQGPARRRRPAGDLPLDAIDIRLGELEWAGHRIRDIRLAAHRSGRVWSVDTQCSLMEGVLRIPVSFQSGLPLSMDLSYLRIQTGQGGDGRAEIDPRTLPSLRVSSKVLEIDGRRFSDLRLETTRLPGGMQIHALRLSAPSFQAQANGLWRVANNGLQQTYLHGSMKSDDLGDALQWLGLGGEIEAGKADIRMDLRWSGAPYRVAEYRGLHGRVEVAIRKGRIKDVETGAGRLIGLLNLGALSRRLSLDFSDLFKKGFVFDSIQGTLIVDGPNLYTSDLVMRGPAAVIEVSGRTGLKAKDYDQEVDVVPQLGGGATVAGALLGGPVVGAAVFVADRLLKGVGSDMGNVTRLRYAVTGTWQDPVIVLIRQAGQAVGAGLDEDYE